MLHKKGDLTKEAFKGYNSYNNRPVRMYERVI